MPKTEGGAPQKKGATGASLQSLIDHVGKEQLPLRLLVAKEDDEEDELGEDHVVEQHHEVSMLEIV